MKLFQNLFLLACLGLAVGCAHLDPGTAQKPSPYITAPGQAPDTLLFDAEQSITTGYDLLHLFVSWEFKNRAQLAGVKEIRQVADNIRKHAEEWVDSAARLHDAYKLNPTPETRSALVDSLNVIQQAIGEATLYLSKYGPGKPK